MCLMFFFFWQVGGSDQLGNLSSGHDFVKRVTGKDVYGKLKFWEATGVQYLSVVYQVMCIKSWTELQFSQCC